MFFFFLKNVIVIFITQYLNKFSHSWLLNPADCFRTRNIKSHPIFPLKIKTVREYVKCENAEMYCPI